MTLTFKSTRDGEVVSIDVKVMPWGWKSLDDRFRYTARGNRLYVLGPRDRQTRFAGLLEGGDE